MSLIVGVIGGMGPAATTHFMARVQALTPAAGDQDHLHLLVDCNPHVPDRNAAATAGGPSPAKVLAEMARGLERAGAQLLVMPCNTAHAYAGDIRAAVSIPFIDLIEAVADAAVVDRPAAVGLMAADGCLEAGLYQDAFARRGTRVILPDAETQAEFMPTLYRVKCGDLGPVVRAKTRLVAEGLIADGAEVIVAGCTEVPLVLGYEDISVALADSIEILARRTVEAAQA
jgi:aspartate racemase